MNRLRTGARGIARVGDQSNETGLQGADGLDVSGLSPIDVRRSERASLTSRGGSTELARRCQSGVEFTATWTRRPA